MHTFRFYVRLLAIPLLFLGLYISLSLVWSLLDLPVAGELMVIVKNWFDVYGAPALFFSSILEGMLLVGSYFPGVFVIFVGVIVADSFTEALFAIAVATLGLMVAHIVNYLLGKYGWYKLLIRFGMKGAVEKAQERLVKKGPVAILVSYWLPSMGALTDTAAGIIQLPFRTFLFYSIISAVFWDTLVGLIVYGMGEKALSVATGGMGSSDGTGSLIVYTVGVVWIAFLLLEHWFSVHGKIRR